jgi:hypothetical protein
VIAVRFVRPVGSVGSIGSVGSVRAAIAGPARKAIVDADTAAKSRSGPVIATASGRPMMKPVADPSAAAKTTTTTEAATAATAASPPRVAVIDG